MGGGGLSFAGGGVTDQGLGLDPQNIQEWLGGCTLHPSHTSYETFQVPAWAPAPLLATFTALSVWAMNLLMRSGGGTVVNTATEDLPEHRL